VRSSHRPGQISILAGARQWPLYLLVIVGPVGFLLNQNAFQAGILISLVLAIITTADPLVSISIAHFRPKRP
jgi:hypothetical protein